MEGPDTIAPITNKTLIVIVGPTAVGKTDVAIRLAHYYNTAIISADSRQFFREMAIGTAKPTPQELAQAKHYFVNSHSITNTFTVGDFETEGLKALDEIFTNHDIAILAGGSGLYVKAICEGFDDLPVVDPQIRDRLNAEYQQNGIDPLIQRLKHTDPEYFAQVDTGNPQRLIRALEVIESTGNKFSSYRTGQSKQRPFNIIKIGLNLPRQLLYQRINLRVDLMVQQGLIDEVRLLSPYQNLNALNTVGYKEIFGYLNGESDLDAAISMVKQNTRRFAKRQLTWFNRDENINWFQPQQFELIIQMINEQK